MVYHVLSLGAGVNSTALLHILADEALPLDEVVFADTGAEKPETYEYIERWIKPFLVERGIPFARVASTIGKGAAKTEQTLTERCLRNHSVPMKHPRWCTRDFKVLPMNRYLGIPGVKTKRPPTERWIMYLGIAYDEPHRIKEAEEPWVERRWPLWERKIDRERCKQIIEAKGWPLPVKSGCFYCPFSPIAEWRWLHDTHPDLWDKSKEIEQNGRFYPQFGLNHLTLVELEKRFRGEKSQSTLDSFKDEECDGFCMT